MSACVIPVLERFRRGNKSARARSRKAANTRESKETVMAPDTVRVMMPRSSSVPPEPRSRRGIALEPGEEEERDVGVPYLTQRDSRGFTIFRSGLSVRHDHPTLGLGDAAYQRQHQAHRMNVEQYQELQRQLASSERAPSTPPQRGVMSLGLPDNLRPGTLFRRIRNDIDNGNLDSSNSSSDRRSSLPRRTKKLPSTFSAESPHFYSSLKRGGSFSSGRGSDSTSCSSLEPAAAGNGMAVAAYIPPRSNGPMGRRPPSYLLPKALSPCPPAKMHPFIPNLGRTLQQQQQPATVDRKGRPPGSNSKRGMQLGAIHKGCPQVGGLPPPCKYLGQYQKYVTFPPLVWFWRTPFPLSTDVI